MTADPIALTMNLPLTDAAFVVAFETGQVSPAAFSHRAHVRLAWIYLRAHPLAEAGARFTAGIRAFAASVGKPEKYHETITWAYLLIISDRATRTGAADFDSFALANPDLLQNGRALLERWYLASTLDAPLARERFLWPDRLPATDVAAADAVAATESAAAVEAAAAADVGIATV